MFSECPAKTQSGFGIACKVEVPCPAPSVAFQLRGPVSFVGKATLLLACGIRLHAKFNAEFRTEIQAFVNIEINAGESHHVEHVR